MATAQIVPRNRTVQARNRSVPSPVSGHVQPPSARTSSQLIDRIADVRIETAPEEAQLPSLLEEAETLTKSFEDLQSNGSAARQEGSQARAARRARRRGKPDANADKLPVFSTRSSTRDSRQRASLATASSATEPLAPAADNTHITAGLSARRTQKARNWGKAKSDQQVEHSWGGIATQTRVTSLKPKEEFELTTRLKKYFKLKERYDSLASSLGSAPSIEDFARRLGTDKVSTIAAIMRDGPKQKAAMVRHNMGLVVNIVNKYEHPDVTKEEMKSAAVEGLVHAIKLFDPAKGFKFSTYAHWWVRQAVNKILAVESRIVYVPQNVYELSIQAITIASQLKSEYHPAPVPDEAVAEKMGVTLKRLRDIKSAVKDPVSMNQTVNSSSEAEVGEMVSDVGAVKSDDLLIEDSMEQAIDTYLRQLPARDAGVLRMRYGVGGFERPHTLEEIGFRYAVTRERIRQIEMKAFVQLRQSSFCDELTEYTAEQTNDLTRTSSAIGRKAQ